MLVYSSGDMLFLVAEVYTRRAAKVVGKVARLTGKTFFSYMDTAPLTAQEGLRTAHLLHQRYMRGDYRHDDQDVGRLEHFCNWLVEIGQSASGHDPRPFAIDKRGMVAKQPLEKGVYAEVLVKLRQL